MCKSTGALFKTFLLLPWKKKSAIKNPFKMWQGGTPDILTAPPAGLLKKTNSWRVSFSYLQLEADYAKTSFQEKDKNKLSSHRDLKSDRATHSANTLSHNCCSSRFTPGIFFFIQNIFFYECLFAYSHIKQLHLADCRWFCAPANVSPLPFLLSCIMKNPSQLQLLWLN